MEGEEEIKEVKYAEEIHPLRIAAENGNMAFCQFLVSVMFEETAVL